MVCVFISITLVFGWLSGAAVIRPPALLPGPQKSPRPPRHAPLRATSGRRLSVLSAEHPVVRLPPVHHKGAVEAGPPPTTREGPRRGLSRAARRQFEEEAKVARETGTGARGYALATTARGFSLRGACSFTRETARGFA